MITHRAAALFVLISVPLLTATAQTKAYPRGQSTSADAITLRDGWSLQSSCKVEQKGEVISTPKFAPTGWYAVSVPTTVVTALVNHKVLPNPDYGTNLRNFPGMNYPIGANFSNIPMRQDSPFLVPWWYRKTFTIPAGYKGKTIWLDFGGINYRANVFLNGKQIGDYDHIAGAWRMEIACDQTKGAILLIDTGRGVQYAGQGMFRGWSQSELGTLYQSLIPKVETEVVMMQLG